MQRQTGGPGGNTSYYALDTAMFDGYGAKLGDTDAFTGGSEPTRDAMGFQGQFGAYTDNETGLVLMGHRYYDAGTGRFLTRDPLGYGGGINLYGFTGNNPVNEMDPDGTQTPSGGNPDDDSINAFYANKRNVLSGINKGAGIAKAGAGVVANSLPGVNYAEGALGKDALGSRLSLGQRGILLVPILGTVIHKYGFLEKFASSEKGVELEAALAKYLSRKGAEVVTDAKKLSFTLAGKEGIFDGQIGKLLYEVKSELNTDSKSISGFWRQVENQSTYARSRGMNYRVFIKGKVPSVYAEGLAKRGIRYTRLK